MLALLLPALLHAVPALHCPDGFEAVGPDACLEAPRPLLRPDKLVVYLHGMLAANADWSATPEFKVVGAEAKRRGYTLIAMRGELGLCYWGKEVKDYYCWPSDRSMQVELGRTLKRMGDVLTRVGERLGTRLGEPLYAGFSNGGFFLSMLASESKIPARGYAVLHAGSVTGQQFTAERARPTILLAAKSDVVQLPTMRRLEQLLGEAGWKTTFNLRDGAHEVTAVDAKAMFEFFDSLEDQ